MENSNVLQLQHQIFSDFYLCYCGYATCDPPLVFSKAFKQMTGMTPVQFRKKTREDGGIDHSPHRRPRP